MSHEREESGVLIMEKTTTAERLKQIMRDDDLTQADIVKKCRPFCEKFGLKMNRSDISQYISGRVEPKQNKLYIISKALNVSEAWLMGFDVPRERKEENNEPRVLPLDDLTEAEIKEIIAYKQFIINRRGLV